MGSHREDLNSFIPQKMYCDRRILFLTLALILTFSAFEGVKGRPNGQEERRDGGMSNALKYLEELDKYYSQVARPRQRRVEQNLSSALERLSAIKNYYSEIGRPRFGKRALPNMYAKSPVDNMMYYPGYEQLYE